MPFDISTTLPIREREDGLQELDTFDLSTFTPIEEQPQLEKPKKPLGYTPEMTEEERAQAIVERSYKESGKDVPLGVKADWILSSRTGQLAAKNILGGLATGGVAPAIINSANAIRGIFQLLTEPYKEDRTFSQQVSDTLIKSIYEPEKINNLGGSFQKLAPNLPWQMTGTMGAMAELAIFAPTIFEGGYKALQQFSSKPGQASILIQRLREDTKYVEFIKRLAEKIGRPVEEVDNGIAQQVHKALTDKNYFELLNKNLKIHTGIDLMSERGSIPITRAFVGDTVAYKDPQGQVLSGVIKQVDANRILVDLGGRTVIATLDQLSMRQKEPREVYQLKSPSVIAEKMPQNASKSQVENILISNGVSPSEIEATKINKYLNGKDIINKNELLQHIENNTPEIKEIVRKGTSGNFEGQSIGPKFSAYTLPGGDNYREILLQSEPQGEIKKVIRKVGGENRYNLTGIEEHLQAIDKTFGTRSNFKGQGYVLSFQEAAKRIPKSNYNMLKHMEATRGVQWEDAYFIPYTLDNGRTSQKVLIEGRKEDGTIVHYFRNPGQMTGPGTTKIFEGAKGVSPANYFTNAETNQQETIPEYTREDIPGTATKEVSINTAKPFIGGHWSEKNIFAHIRLKDRVTPDGKRVLFIEEIQSDWMLALRKEKNVSEIPFKNWEEMVLKRILNEAIEGGYDYIAWTTGKQQADRYNLAKQVKKVYARKTEDGNYNIGLETSNGRIIHASDDERLMNVSAENLDEIVGKDLAKKIIDSNKDISEWTGVDLQVGGEWAKTLYDKQIPNMLKDLTKQETKNIDLGGLNKPTMYIREYAQETNPFAVVDRATEEIVKNFSTWDEAKSYIDEKSKRYIVVNTLTNEPVIKDMAYTKEEAETIAARMRRQNRSTWQGQPQDWVVKPLSSTQPAIEITPNIRSISKQGFSMFGKIPQDVGKPGIEHKMQIFRMDESTKVLSTSGKEVTLPKGEEYRTLPVYDQKGNIVPNKITLVDGKQVTVYSGELNKLKGKIIGQPMAGGMTEDTRRMKRRASMREWNNPQIADKLLKSEQEFIKQYIDENKSLEEISRETGEDIEDLRNTERWTYSHMEEISNEQESELRSGMEEAQNEEYNDNRKKLKDELQGQLDPALKNEGEYSKLKHLPWLWAKENSGVRPDELASEIQDMGFPIEPTETDVIGLIETYFDKEIQGRAEQVASQESKTYARKIQKSISSKTKAPKISQKEPERKITGVGNGSVISTREDIDGSERARIFKEMPFTLLGNKAEVLSRLPDSFKKIITNGVENVYDLWGGAKGYRIGLFPQLPAPKYNLNELSDERNNYYNNMQDPEKVKIIKKTLTDIKTQFIDVMSNAFGIPEAKNNQDFLDMLNSWLRMGLKKERYIYAREIIQEFGDKLLSESIVDNFTSPESSAKYYFLENTALFGLKSTEEGYEWTQGIIRTTTGQSNISDILNKIAKFNEQLDSELKRDKGMQITQEDAWDVMDKVTEGIKSGAIDYNTTCVLVDPQYLNPTEKAGTYSVGTGDTTWEGHKANLEKHLLPLAKTGVKIIYTNNADQQLLEWLRKNNLPYNIETRIGSIAERRGRDETISFINFKFPREYVSSPSTGAEQPMGSIQQGGAGTPEPGQQYVAPRVTGQSERFTKWLEERKLKEQEELDKQKLISRISELQKNKMLSNTTISRIKKFLGIAEMKNTKIPEIQKLIDYLDALKTGDKLLSERQVETIQKMFPEIKNLEVMPQRIALEQFGDKEDILSGMITGKLPNEIFPTVDIAEGHPYIEKTKNDARDTMTYADEEVDRRDKQVSEMLRKAEKSRILSTKERIKRFIAPQNKEIFQALSGQKVELTKEETAVVAYLQNFFAKVKKDLALEKYRKNYVTRLEQPLTEKIMDKGIIGALKQVLQESRKGKDLPTDIMLELDNIVGSKKFFRFALQRKGGLDPTTNLRKIIHEYSMLYETKKALDKILPDSQIIMRSFLSGKNAVWLKKFLQNLKGRGLDYELRTGKAAPVIKAADTIVNMGYVWLLSFNLPSALKNIVAGETNSIIFQDIGNYIKGKQRMFSNPIKAYRIARENGILEGTYVDYAEMGLNKLKKLANIAMLGQQAGEYEIRGSLFAGELSDKEWETGKISKEHLNAIKDKIAITQGIFSKVDSPLWMQTWYGRLIMQMNRWRVTNAMLLRRIVEGAKKEWSSKNYTGTNTRRLLKLLTLYSVGLYMSYEFGKMGWKKAQQVAKAMQEDINNIVELPSAIINMVTNNPTINMIRMLLFTSQEISSFMFGTEPPRKIEFNRGIEDIYIPAINQFTDNTSTSSNRQPAKIRR